MGVFESTNIICAITTHQCYIAQTLKAGDNKFLYKKGQEIKKKSVIQPQYFNILNCHPLPKKLGNYSFVML